MGLRVQLFMVGNLHLLRLRLPALRSVALAALKLSLNDYLGSRIFSGPGSPVLGSLDFVNCCYFVVRVAIVRVSSFVDISSEYSSSWSFGL